MINSRQELQKVLNLPNDPTVTQFREALTGNNIEITSTGRPTQTLTTDNAYLNMLHMPPGDHINVTLSKPIDTTKERYLPGDYLIVRSRFKDGGLEFLLSLSNHDIHRKQAFYIKLTEIPSILTPNDCNAIKTIRCTGRPGYQH